MDQNELLLYLEREKLKKEAIENSERIIGVRSSSIKKIGKSNVVNLDNSEVSSGSDDGKNSSSSIQISNHSLSINAGQVIGKSETVSFKNVSDLKYSDSSTSAVPIKVADDGVAKISSGSVSGKGAVASHIPTITNWAVVKFTGPENYGKSAYTVGKKSGERARKAIDYIVKDGLENKIDKNLDYMSRDIKEETNLEDDFKSRILFDKNGAELSIGEAKKLFGDDITGERRIVFSPNSNIKMSNSEFQKTISKTLDGFGEKFHKNYDLIYTVHRNTNNPHAHIILKTDDVDSNGIKMFKDELFELKMRFYDNTQALAESKKSLFTFFYKDETSYSTAMQIARFTGDVPGSEFAKQNIYLAEKIAKKYNLEFDQKSMERNTGNVKQFFETNKDNYYEFTTNAKNSYADTFTKFSNDANALAAKYGLGEVPKDMDGFVQFLKQHEKLFLADRIATDKGLDLTSKDAKNITLEIEKNTEGKLTTNGRKNSMKSMKWFKKNTDSVKEWNSENKNRMSKETFSRLDNLNSRIDNPFDMPKDRVGAITLTNHYKMSKMDFANDTRKALVDVVEARIKYFQKASKADEISRTEKKTNIERLDGLRGQIQAYNDITVSSLKQYGIDTAFFAKDEKIIEMDGIKLESNENIQKLESLLNKATQDPELTQEQKKKLDNIDHIVKKEKHISVSALENAGFKREDLQKEFNVEKIETKQQILNIKMTDEFKNLNSVSLKDWKDENSNSYVYVSKLKMDRMMADFENSMIENEKLKGKNKYLDSYIDTVNKNLNKIENNLKKEWDISKEDAQRAGIDISKTDTTTKDKDIEFIQKNKTNDVLMGLLIEKDTFDKLKETYDENILKKYHFKSTLEWNNLETKNVMVFDSEIRSIKQEVINNPMSLNLKGETISNGLFHEKNGTYNFVKEQLSNEHGVEIKSAKDLAANIDKVETLNPLRVEFANVLNLSIVANSELKGTSKFFDNYIDNVNDNLEKVVNQLLGGKDVLFTDLVKAGIKTDSIETYEKSYNKDHLVNSADNIEKLNFIKSYIDESKFNEMKESVQNGTMQVSNLNYTLGNATEKAGGVFDINFKPLFEVEKKLEQPKEYAKIDTLKDVLLQNQQIGETISTKIATSESYFTKTKEQLSNEHGVEIKSAKDLAANIDKVGTLNPVRVEFANVLGIVQDLNSELKNNNEFINKYIDTSNEHVDKLMKKLIDGKQIEAKEFKAVVPNSTFDTYLKDSKAKYIESSIENTEKLTNFFQKSNLFNNKIQESLLEQLKNGELKNYSLNTNIANATQKAGGVFDINFKPNLNIEENVKKVEHVKISSICNVFKTEQVKENITYRISQSEKFFDKIKNELSNEHGVEIESAKELHDNFDKLGKASDFRMKLIDITNKKIEDFKLENGLQNDSKFEQFIENIAEKKSKIKEMDIESKDLYKLTSIEKEYQGLNGLLNKNMRLKPIFESDLKKLNINGINFKDFTEVKIEVDAIKNIPENKVALLSAFSGLMLKNDDKRKKYELNKIDKKALNNIFDNTRGKSNFKIEADRYITTKSIDKVASLEYLSLLSDAKSLNGFNYIVEKKENISVKVNYLESRGVSTESFLITKEYVTAQTIKMGSKVNEKIFEQHLNTNTSNKLQVVADTNILKNNIKKTELSNKQQPRLSQEQVSSISGFTHNKLSQNEIDSLRALTKETLIRTDPASVLNSLGFDFSAKKNGTQYSFRIRADDKTPSASMYLSRDGVWRFKDFGDDAKGTIENVVMNATGMSYKDALNYSLNASGLKNYLAEAIDTNKNMTEVNLKAEHKARLEEIKNINIEKAKDSAISTKVVSFREITPQDTKEIEFLASRGIESIANNIYIITGESTGAKGTYTNTGIGVLTGDMSKPIELDKVGADIHFLNPRILKNGSTMKTQSFGPKDITIIPGQNMTKDFAIFESKMDYAAAASKVDLGDSNVIIANGIGQAGKIVETLNEQGFEKITFYNQNDAAGEKFVENIVEKAGIDKFEFVKYEAIGEYKQDINDLVKNGIDVEQRLISNATLEDWQSYISENKEAKIEDIQNLIKDGDLKQAELSLKESGLDKSTQDTLSSDIELANTIATISKAQEDTPEFKAQEMEETQKTKDVAIQEKAMEEDFVKTVLDVSSSKEEVGKSKDMVM